MGHGGGIPTIPKQLLGLLGIVTGSSVVGGVISSNKKKTTVPDTPGQTAVQPLAAGDRPIHVGQLAANRKAEDASWADVYLGDDAGNRYVVDISRLQKLLITIILVAIYAAWLWQDFDAPRGAFKEMHSLDEDKTFLWLLGISHAGYLASKATSKPKS